MGPEVEDGKLSVLEPSLEGEGNVVRVEGIDDGAEGVAYGEGCIEAVVVTVYVVWPG